MSIELMTLEERIVDESSRLFIEFGIKAISMDTIAQRVGISKRTLYETYSSKDELLVRCLKHMNEKHEEELQNLCATTDDFVEMLVVFLADIIKQMKSVNPLFYHEMSRYHYLAAGEAYNEDQEKRRQGLIAFLKRGISEGYVLPTIDLDITADIFLNQQFLNHRQLVVERASVEQIFGTVFVTLFRGICTIKGCERFDELISRTTF